jgi:hypothetical protein
MLSTTDTLEFHDIQLEDAEYAVPLLRNSGLRGCEFSFTTIFMWRRHYKNRISRYGDHLFICSGDVMPMYLLPIGGDLREGIEILKEQAHRKDEPLILFGAHESLKEQIEQWYPGRFDWQLLPNEFDYIYNTEDLVNLKGKKYHSKRNHIASFSASHDWSYESIGDHNMDETIQMTKEWCKERGNCTDPDLKDEHCAIREALHHMEELSLRGGLLRVDGKVIAMTMGSPISEHVFDIHTEKALPAFSTAYAVINHEFAARELQGKYSYINRENDLGIEGLRRAKKSYRPAILLEKYLATEIVR